MAVRRAAAHQEILSLHYDDEGLLGDRSPIAYNETEQQYSVLLYKRIEQLLKGERNALLILRRYPREPDRLGVMPTPAEIDRAALRLETIERMATDALVFLSAHAPGGPVAQQIDDSGRLAETRKFPTRFPHIIIERLDLYPDGDREQPEYVQWYARRLQNQRRTLRLNQMLDLANLGIEAVRLLLP